MKINITNNLNYEREEQIRLEKLKEREKIAKESMIASVNMYLDKVQRVFDYKTYTIHHHRSLFHSEDRITIVLGYSFYYDNQGSGYLPIMNEVAKVIKSKYPQWHVYGFHHGSITNDNHNGNFGICISGDLSGL